MRVLRGEPLPFIGGTEAALKEAAEIISEGTGKES